MEVPIQPEHADKTGLTKSQLTTVYLAGFFVSIIAMMAFYVFYVQWFVDLLSPNFGFDKAFDIVTWFTPIAWLVIANLFAIVLLYLTPLVFPLKDDAKKMLYGNFTRSMLLAIILCLISLVFLDIVVYIVNKDLKIVELVPLVLLAIWFYIYRKL